MAKSPFPPPKTSAPAKGGKPMPPWLQKKAPAAGKPMPAMKSGGKVKSC